jgi:DNA-binding MarR family transcriptional regulator
MTDSLQETLRQGRPFGSLEQEAFLNVIRTASELADGMDGVLREAGLSPAQYNVLRILRGAEPNGMCRNEVRDRMLTRMPDMTRLLDRMEAAGLVRRTPHPEDRRMVSTRITAAGLELLETLGPRVDAEHRRSLGHMDQGELTKLIDLLSRARARR